jgi:polyphenol oxidase
MESDFKRALSGDLPGIRTGANGVSILAVPGWERYDWLWHGFSTRKGGVSRAYLDAGGDEFTGELNLGFTASDEREAVIENRLRLIEAVSESRETAFATVRQVHSNRSVVIESGWHGWEQGGLAIPEADGLMTCARGVLLGIQVADCIPVLVADTGKRAVAAFHAGWRGTVERIVEVGVAKMQEEFGSEPGEMVAAIGQGIGRCCYAVGDEVRQRFEANFAYADGLFKADTESGALRLDLIEANRRQLMAAGVAAENISIVGGCTNCNPEWFYSHRGSGGNAGRMMAVIGIG